MRDKTKAKNTVKIGRLKELIDQKTREETAAGIGCETSLVTKHYNEDRKVTIEQLIQYCAFFHVSADYLLGLSDAKTADKDIQFICDYTGLSQEAVKVLNTRYKIFEATTDCDILSSLITYEDNIFYDIGKHLNGLVSEADRLSGFKLLLLSEIAENEQSRSIWEVEPKARSLVDRSNEKANIWLFRAIKAFERFIDSYTQKELKSYKEAEEKATQECEQIINTAKELVAGRAKVDIPLDDWRRIINGNDTEA